MESASFVGCLFLAAIAFNFMVNLVAGERFSQAAWSAVREVRLVEVIMFVAL